MDYLRHRGEESDVMVAEAVSRDLNSDVKVTAIGEAKEMSGESSIRTDITVPAPQKKHVHRTRHESWVKFRKVEFLRLQKQEYKCATSIISLLFPFVKPFSRSVFQWRSRGHEVFILFNQFKHFFHNFFHLRIAAFH